MEIPHASDYWSHSWNSLNAWATAKKGAFSRNIPVSSLQRRYEHFADFLWFRHLHYCLRESWPIGGVEYNDTYEPCSRLNVKCCIGRAEKNVAEYHGITLCWTLSRKPTSYVYRACAHQTFFYVGAASFLKSVTPKYCFLSAQCTSCTLQYNGA